MRWTRARLIVVFVLLVALGTWPAVALLWSEGAAWSSPLGRAVAVWCAFPPLLAVLFLQGPVLKQPLLKPLGIRFSVNRWWLAAWLTPIAILMVGLGLLALVGEDLVLTTTELIANKRSLVPPDQLAAFEEHLAESPPPHPLMLIVWGLPAGLTFNLFLTLTEEIALRGFLFRELPGSFWQRSLGIGCIWALLWAPAAATGRIYPDGGVMGVLAFAVWCLAATPVLIYLRVRSESVIAVALTRGTILALTPAAVDLSFHSSVAARPFYGWSGLVGFAVVFTLCWVHDRFYASQRLLV